MSEHPPILIVDDDEGVRTALTDILDFHGYAAVTAVDGAEAVRIFSELVGVPIVIFMVLDLMMPGLNGIETMQRLTAIAPHARIVISTGLDRDEVLARFDLGDYDHGKVYFLTTPFSMATFVGLVERCQRDLPN